ncbi:hypothetical protein [Rubritalea profundi]|uniref:Carbohydrate-binding domain-containing protein n=1 Tax=Rubritalea profundi TaxID=1658618 RepID=A0A2S7U2D0_9BACT|nr:hypothetical protein [Rubritalea profundi]PQJ29155.1 hypothetical protein BSZ32_12075 [Rubritalea profundi]
MNIEISDKPLSWGALDLSLFGVDKDWFGQPVNPPVAFGFAVDLKYLWFIASHQKSPSLHPDARPGDFQAELWKYDVAEFFLTDPKTGRYLEFNLAPNGAWWSAEFTAPRIRAEIADNPFPEVATFADMAQDGSWLAAAAIPLEQLRNKLNFSPESHLNATFILNSPEQQFLSATKLGGGEPDFHLPDKFPKVNFFHNQKE